MSIRIFRILLKVTLILSLSPHLAAQDKTSDYLDHAKGLISQSQFDSALIVLNQGQATAHEQGLDSLMGRILITKAGVLLDVHKEDLAMEYYIQARLLGEKTENDHLIGKGILGIGVTHFFQEQFDSSLHYYEKSIPFFERVNDLHNLIGVKNNIGYLFAKQGLTEKAERYYKEVINTGLAMGDSALVKSTFFNLGMALGEQGLQERAINYFNKSLEVSERLGNKLDIAKCQREIGRMLFGLGDYKKAAEHYMVYDSLVYEHVNQDYNDKILELETKFKTSEIERDNALKELKIEEQQQNLTLLLGLTVITVMVIIAVYFYNEQRKKALRTLAAKQQEINIRKIGELLSQQEIKTTYALLEGQDRERNRIAQELHDNISSTMVTMAMFLQSFKPKSLSPEESTILEKVTNIAEKATEDTRKLSHSLDSGSLKHFGLRTAIKDLAEAVERTTETSITLSQDLLTGLPAEIGLNVYRIIQELINNTLKHAKAKHIKLEVTEIQDDYVTIIYEDDGIGFDATQQSEGMGLRNIRSRAEKLNGQITIESRKGQTICVVEIPV